MSKGSPIPPHNPCLLLLSKVEMAIKDHLSLNLNWWVVALQTYGLKVVRESWAYWKMCCDWLAMSALATSVGVYAVHAASYVSVLSNVKEWDWLGGFLQDLWRPIWKSFLWGWNAASDKKSYCWVAKCCLPSSTPPPSLDPRPTNQGILSMPAKKVRTLHLQLWGKIRVPIVTRNSTSDRYPKACSGTCRGIKPSRFSQFPSEEEGGCSQMEKVCCHVAV